MINSSIKTNFLNLLVGNASSMSGSFGTAYICLGYDVLEDPVTGDISRFDEPTAGYHRYLIGNSGQSLTQKISVTRGVATNKDTLYFDEAEADWTTEDHKLKYFGIASSDDSLPFAYGHIVDQSGTPIELEVKIHQVPIIKAGQLTLAITDKEELPVKTYYIKVFTETAGSYTQIAKMTVKTTARYIYQKYQVAATALTVFESYTVDLNVGESYLIENLPQIVDNPEPEQYVDLYRNNNIKTDYKILVFSEDPEQE